MDATTLVHALFDAIEAGDYEAANALFTADAVIWHNVSNREQPLRESNEMLRAVRTFLSSCRYEERRYFAAPGGAVGQHVGRTTLKEGGGTEIHTMLRVYTEGERIRRVEEYFDTAQAKPLMDKLQSFWNSSART